jgi:hypothetical protein
VLEYESQHLPHKSPSFVGKYAIHGAFGNGDTIIYKYRTKQSGDIGLPWPRETLNKWYHGIAHLKKQSYVFGKHLIPSGKLT